jgi:hypothetical protein
MKALIQKDLKENLKVALIGLLIFSVVLLAGYRSCTLAVANLFIRNVAGPLTNLQPLLASNVLIGAACFCALFGAALGWLQTRNEAHRDLWAFLIHRPMTRVEIFRAKTIAGLCLYILGAGLPMVVLVAAVRVPGNVAAPFEWAMLLPLGLIFLMGIAFYFAGLLTGLRQARWYASRGLGLGLPILAAFGVFGFNELQWSFIGIAVAVLVLATAARGAYQSSGFYGGQPMAGRLALIITMAVGCTFSLLAGLSFLIHLVVAPLTSPSHMTFSYYQMTRDGTIYQMIMRDNELVEVTDLQGHQPIDPKTGRKMEPKDVRTVVALSGTIITDWNHPKEDHNLIQGSINFFSLVNISDKTLWYLDRHGKLLGYDGLTRKFIGSLEPPDDNGTPGPGPFLKSPNSYYYYYEPYNGVSQKLLPTAKNVYRVDFKERSVKLVFSLTNDDAIGGYTDNLARYDDYRKRDFAITTHQVICAMDYDGNPIFRVPYQPAYPEYPQVQVSLLQPQNGGTNLFALWFYPDTRKNAAAGWKMPIHVLWVGPEQTVTKSDDLPTIRQPEFSSGPDQIATALLPPVLHVIFDTELKTGWNLFGFAMAFVFAISGGLLARRYHFPTRACVGWFLFIFVLGIGGLLALWCVEDWPKREVCPHCKKLRTVENETCEHCRSPFLSPEKNGTEIFAPLIKA